MYPLVLTLHSWWRWLVLAAGLVVLIRATAGWAGGRAWSRADHRLGGLFVGVLDAQVLLGLLLYGWLSPISWAALMDLRGAMSDSVARFWAVEHVFGMLGAVVIAHIGRGRAVAAIGDVRRHRSVALSVGLSLLVIALTIPWPGTPYARPLLRAW